LYVSACGVTPDNTIDIVFDACAPISLSTDDGRAASVRDAFALWGMEPRTGGAEIPLVFDDAAEAFHGLYDDEHGVIYINSRITDPDALAIVLAHELGHAMGLPHIELPASVMRSGNTTITPSADDEARLHALWGPCESTEPLEP
jgi:hypothetical protein